jgi:radical SAM superfamily enzyme YgiQ (UPF0313 family)
MKILLIYPCQVDQHEKPIKYRKGFFPPLSLAILNGLTPPHHTVTIVNDVLEDIDFSLSYDLVGITAMSLQSTRAYQLAKHYRNAGARVVIGGFHATLLPEEVKQHCDSVVIGEAENLWEKILIDCENDNLKEFYKDDSLPDLSRQVIPVWDNFNLKKYPKWLGFKYPMMPIYTTRGCPFACRFCSVAQVYGKTYRVRPIEHVIQEVERLDAEFYFIVDDNIGSNIEYSRELFTALARIRKRKNFKWISQISTTIINHPELIQLMAESGCHSVFIGIETINTETLKHMNKNFNKVDQYWKLFGMMREAGIGPIASVMFGMDEDRPDIFRKTLEFLMGGKVFNAFYFIFTPPPGSKLLDEMTAEGRVLHNNWHFYDGAHSVFRPKHMTSEELTKSFWDLYNEFYSLKNILKRMYNTARISPNPIKSIFENTLFYWIFRRAVRSYQHPLSGGLGKSL